MQPLLNERDQGFFFHLGGDLSGMDQPPLELGEAAEQAPKGKEQQQKEGEKNPQRRTGEGPTEGSRRSQREEAGADDLGLRVSYDSSTTSGTISPLVRLSAWRTAASIRSFSASLKIVWAVSLGMKKPFLKAALARSLRLLEL
jgi:hypothetical protein